MTQDRRTLIGIPHPHARDGRIVVYRSGIGNDYEELSTALDWGEAADVSSADIGDSAGAGSANEVARADHVHSFPAPGAGYPVDVDTGAEADGSATTPARSDHKHALNVPAKNITAITTLLSAGFAIDSTGVKTVTTAHGLSVTPSIQDVQLTVTEDSNVDDWAFNLLKVESTDGTNVVCKINISTASATGGATAKLAILVITGV